ncbi:protocadherin-18-like [Arapaima gigas]
MSSEKGKDLTCFFLPTLLSLLIFTHCASGKNLKYKVYEEQKVGTVIARLREDVADVLSKVPGSVPVRFRAMQRGTTSFLSVREEDGEISIGAKIDREKLCELNLNCSIEFDVITLPTEHLQLFHVEVEVLDINDNSPQFSRPTIPIEISESATVGTRIPLDSATDPDNDNPPVIVVPQLRNYTADVPVFKYSEMGNLITTVRATDRDSGVNAELTCSIVAGNEDGYFSMDPKKCEIRANASMQDVPREYVELVVMVQDQGPTRLSTKAVLKCTLYENIPDNPQPVPTNSSQASLDVSMIIIISLGAICTVLLVIMVMFATRCNKEKNDMRSYNCRVAESTYQNHPKKPSRQVHKGDITLVPTVNGTLPIRAHHRSPSPSPPMERGQLGSRQSHHSRQSLNSLVTISSNHIPENFSLELAHATPPVEQVSQLLSMLHQGQYQPRPSFRGNKYSRSYRYALQDMDKFSLKDSGRGDSEAGDSDYDMGRESPIDRLLGEGFSELFFADGHYRLNPAMKLCTEECRVLGHSDQCWMPPLPSPASSDYRNNMFIPGEDPQQPTTEEDQQSVDSNDRKKSFSTFGKESAGEDLEGGDLSGASLLSEMSSVFQRLLPSSPDSYVECSESERAGSLERRKGHLPGKPSAYPQGVAAWAANTHFQNPGSCIGPAQSNHAGAQAPLKWLPAMEEIPENYEEDEFDSVLSQLQGKRSDSRHEIMDASELVVEINKLLKDVQQS